MQQLKKDDLYNIQEINNRKQHLIVSVIIWNNCHILQF